MLKDFSTYHIIAVSIASRTRQMRIANVTVIMLVWNCRQMEGGILDTLPVQHVKIKITVLLELNKTCKKKQQYFVSYIWIKSWILSKHWVFLIMGALCFVICLFLKDLAKRCALTVYIFFPWWVIDSPSHIVCYNYKLCYTM